MDTLLDQVLSIADSEWQKLVDQRRFWKQIDKSGGSDSCWPWIGCWDKGSGYGVGRLNKKTNHAHRISYILTTGDHLDSMTVVRHTCDNRICCNPKHLLSGTHADNINDRLERKGDQKGENNFASKLTQDQVNEMRLLANTGIPQDVLANQFSVSNGAVSTIVNGKTWKHSFNSLLVPEKHRRLNREQVQSIVSNFKSGKYNQRELAEQYRISNSLVSSIVTGRSYKNYV